MSWQTTALISALYAVKDTMGYCGLREPLRASNPSLRRQRVPSIYIHRKKTERRLLEGGVLRGRISCFVIYSLTAACLQRETMAWEDVFAYLDFHA